MSQAGGETRIPRFTIEQVVILLSLLVAMATSWASLKAAMDDTRTTLHRVEELSTTMRGRQIRNEGIIDQHSTEIEETQKHLKLPVNRHQIAGGGSQ